MPVDNKTFGDAWCEYTSTHTGPIGITGSITYTNVKPPTLYCYSHNRKLPYIKEIIVNPPATIIIWKDGTKTICKAGDGEEYDEEVGVAMCIAKKYFGSRNQLKKASKKAYDSWWKKVTKNMEKVKKMKKGATK